MCAVRRRSRTSCTCGRLGPLLTLLSCDGLTVAPASDTGASQQAAPGLKKPFGPPGPNVARRAVLGIVTADAGSRLRTRPQDQGAARRRDPAAVRRLLRRARPHGRAQRFPRPGRRPDAALRELGDGAVQGRADRGREALVHARRRLPALPARRRQAQRLRGGRAHAPPPHLLRDARELELRRLLQARGHPLGVGAAHEGLRHPAGAPRCHDVHDRRHRVRDLARRDRPATRAPRPLGRLPERRREELVADGRRRAVWTMLRDPCRPGRAPVRGPALRARPLGDVSALARDLEPRVHGVRSPAGSLAGGAARARRRHRHGPRTAGERPPAGADQLRHRPVRTDPRPHAGAARARPGGVRSRALQLPGDRRSLAGGDIPDRGRDPALERGARLRAAQAGPPRGAPRPAARPDRAVPRRDGGRRDRHDGRGVPAPDRAAGRDHRGAPPRGGAVRADARRRDGPARRGALAARDERARDRPCSRRPARRRAGAPGRRRVPAPRHVRLPGRPDRRAGRGVRGPARSRGLRPGARRAARAEPFREEGRAREAGGTWRALPGHPGPRRRHPLPRLRDDHRRGPGGRDRARRDRVRRADRDGRGRGRPRRHAVLRRGWWPGRRPGRDPRTRVAAASCSP